MAQRNNVWDLGIVGVEGVRYSFSPIGQTGCSPRHVAKKIRKVWLKVKLNCNFLENLLKNCILLPEVLFFLYLERNSRNFLAICSIPQFPVSNQCWVVDNNRKLNCKLQVPSSLVGLLIFPSVFFFWGGGPIKGEVLTVPKRKRNGHMLIGVVHFFHMKVMKIKFVSHVIHRNPWSWNKHDIFLAPSWYSSSAGHYNTICSVVGTSLKLTSQNLTLRYGSTQVLFLIEFFFWFSSLALKKFKK